MPTSDTDRAKMEALAEIKERIRARVVEARVEAGPVDKPTLELPDFGVLRRFSDELKISCAQIGNIPPQPPTLRGRIGAFLVRLVQRTLFWYTPQIRVSIDGIVRLFQYYIDKTEELVRSGRQEQELSRKQIADLAAKIVNLETRVKRREERIEALEAALHSYQESLDENPRPASHA